MTPIGTVKTKSVNINKIGVTIPIIKLPMSNIKAFFFKFFEKREDGGICGDGMQQKIKGGI